jgi:large subunit ribosomal protein L16
VAFGEYGLQALEGGRISAEVLEAGRVVASRLARAGGKLYIRVFPQKSVTSIPAETRMGKGKGEIEYWAAVIKPGTILYELAGVTEEEARSAFARVAYKMPVACRFVTRRPTV